MKFILNNEALKAAVKDFVANPAAEFPTVNVIEKATVLDENGKMVSKETTVLKPHGMTQRQQALLTITLLRELGLLAEPATPEQGQRDFVQTLQVLFDMGNASAARQALEKAGILAETPGGSKRGTDVAALAAKWMPKA